MRLPQFRIQFESLLPLGFCLNEASRSCTTPVRKFKVSFSHGSIRGGKGGGSGRSVLEITERLCEVVAVEAVPIKPSSEISLVRGRVNGTNGGELVLSTRTQTHAYLIRDLPGNIFLHYQDFSQIALITVGPEVLVGASIDQLCGDAHPIPRAHNRTLDNGVHPEFLR